MEAKDAVVASGLLTFSIKNGDAKPGPDTSAFAVGFETGLAFALIDSELANRFISVVSEEQAKWACSQAPYSTGMISIPELAAMLKSKCKEKAQLYVDELRKALDQVEHHVCADQHCCDENMAQGVG